MRSRFRMQSVERRQNGGFVHCPIEKGGDVRDGFPAWPAAQVIRQSRGDDRSEGAGQPSIRQRAMRKQGLGQRDANTRGRGVDHLVGSKRLEHHRVLPCRLVGKARNVGPACPGRSLPLPHRIGNMQNGGFVQVVRAANAARCEKLRAGNRDQKFGVQFDAVKIARRRMGIADDYIRPIFGHCVHTAFSLDVHENVGSELGESMQSGQQPLADDRPAGIDPQAGGRLAWTDSVNRLAYRQKGIAQDWLQRLTMGREMNRPDLAGEQDYAKIRLKSLDLLTNCAGSHMKFGSRGFERPSTGRGLKGAQTGQGRQTAQRHDCGFHELVFLNCKPKSSALSRKDNAPLMLQEHTYNYVKGGVSGIQLPASGEQSE